MELELIIFSHNSEPRYYKNVFHYCVGEKKIKICNFAMLIMWRKSLELIPVKYTMVNDQTVL